MRKLVIYTLLSLDGVAEHPDHYVLEWDAAMDADLSRVIAGQDAVLLGRRTYDDWVAFWPKSDIQPFADFINGVPKYVVTSSEPAVPWARTTVVSEDVTGFVRKLKEQPGRDIGVHGSIDLARTLLDAGLVDELRLVVTPVLAGSGRKLFADGPVRKLDLLQVETTPTGTTLAAYVVPARGEG